jgi:radical SAM superfamily enzyme YgiQ (UPF0313 family)
MELPSRPEHDKFVPAGGFSRMAAAAKAGSANADVPTLIVHAFDPRTRMLPFIMWDKQIIPAGVRAVSSAMAAAGFETQRVVTNSWTPNIRPSLARLNGKPIEVLLVSSMQIHAATANRMILDAHLMGENRPLIIAGGPKAIYQGWDLFGLDAAGHGADIACTGEEYVLMELFDRLNRAKTKGETFRQAFNRARDRGWLDDVPGLMYELPGAPGERRKIVDTGVQRLVRDFDDLPTPWLGYCYIEPPHHRESLSAAPMPLSKVGKYGKVASILTTRGCKFRCGYCPIPAYNQFSFRTKSPEGLVHDIRGLRRNVGINMFFGTDDNFFNQEDTVVETFEAMARAGFEKDDIGKAARFGTEGTEFDVHKQLAHMPLAYRGGLRGIWFGIEDMTATLVKKGQSVEKTAEVFAELRRNRIQPMAMMMHFDTQPLRSPKGTMTGLLNQVDYLKKVGAASLQCTVLTPAVGTKDFDQVMQAGIVLDTIGGKKIDDYLFDGNHVISVGSNKEPWNPQWNMLRAYASFYNPVQLVKAFFSKVTGGRAKWGDVFLQLWGMWGLAVTFARLLPWLYKLHRVKQGQYTVKNSIPGADLDIIDPPGKHAADGPQTYIRQTIGDANDPAKKSARASLQLY